MRIHVPMLLALLVAGLPMVSVVEPAAAATARVVYSVEDTDLGTLVDDPAANAVIKKFAPSILAHPQLSLARSLTLGQLQRFDRETLTDEVLASIDAALKKMASK